MHNWAGNLTYQAAALHQPESVAQLQELVAASTSIRALGSRHSFNDLADTAGDLVSLDRLPHKVSISGDSATVSAGMRYGEVAAQLHKAGFGIPNLASLPHISVAGACASATHGSGVHNGNLATAVSAIELVRADGELVTIRRGDADFAGAVVDLGALGIATTMTLDIQPTYDVRQFVYRHLAWDQLVEHFEEIVSSAYSVSLFTRWREIDQAWLKVRDGEPPTDLYGAQPATTDLHPLPDVDAASTTQQLGVPGPWHERLPHFRLDFTPSAGEELQTEYLLPLASALPALQALRPLADRLAPVLQISEIRTVAADDLWLSPSRGSALVAIHFTWIDDWERVSAILPDIEGLLLPLGALPHWGKLFTVSAKHIRESYPQLPKFQALADQLDPAGKFANDFVRRYIR